MSKPVMYQFSRALGARMSHTVSNLTTGEKISLKSIPLICENPLTTSCAFFGYLSSSQKPITNGHLLFVMGALIL